MLKKNLPEFVIFFQKTVYILPLTDKFYPFTENIEIIGDKVF